MALTSAADFALGALRATFSTIRGVTLKPDLAIDADCATGSLIVRALTCAIDAATTFATAGRGGVARFPRKRALPGTHTLFRDQDMI